MSELATLTSIVSPSLDHACIHKMQVRHDTSELLPCRCYLPIFLGVNSVRLWNRICCSRSAVPWRCRSTYPTRHCLSHSEPLRTCCHTAVISCPIFCCRLTMPAWLTLLTLLLLLNLGSPLPAPHATTLSEAPPPCQLEVCFAPLLEPTRLRWWKCDKCCRQVRTVTS